jgi:hypothetical protein
MKQSVIIQARSRLAALCLSLLAVSPCALAQFVELTAELEINDWSYWFFEDKLGLAAARSGKAPSTLFTTSAPIRCVVGTNMWMMESDFVNAKVTRWFTGSNIIERTLITQAMSNEESKRLSQNSGFAGTGPRVGKQHTKTYPTADGNPGRPVHVMDLFMDTGGMMTWLVFCSGPALKREGRQIPPPSAFWKEYFPGEFTDKTVCFEDSLGLPKSIELFTKQGQLVFQYQVRQSTNVLGWKFPTEFYLVQYQRGPGTNSHQVHLTAKGKVTAIKAGTEPRIPAEAPNAVEK